MTENKIRLLIAAHIGEPVGGISINYENLLASNLKDHVDLSFVETSKGTLNFENRGRWKFVNVKNAIFNIFRFTKAVIIHKPHLVHIGTPYNPSFIKHSFMVLIARLCSAKVVMQFHCGFRRFFQTSRMGKYWALWILRQCHGIIIISKEWYALKDLIPDINIAYIPNAIHLSEYLEIKRPRISQENEPIRVLYLGHLSKEKGIFDLLQAADQLRIISNIPFCIDLVGENQYIGEKEQIKQMIDHLSLSEIVKIFPPEYHQKKNDRLAQADLYILPSYHEGMPISIIEAMAASLPVVATNVGGIPDEVIDNQTGILFEPGNIDQLVIGLSQLINNPEKRQQMGVSGQHRAIENFSIDTKVRKLLLFYDGILNCKSEN